MKRIFVIAALLVGILLAACQPTGSGGGGYLSQIQSVGTTASTVRIPLERVYISSSTKSGQVNLK